MTPHLLWLKRQKEFPKLFWQEKCGGHPIACCGQDLPRELFFSLFDFDTLHPFSWSPTHFCEDPGTEEDPLAPLPKPRARSHLPTSETWHSLFARRSLPKLVLGRKTTLTFDTPLDPYVLAIRFFAGAGPETTRFLIEFKPGHTFIGATPERLFQRRDRNLEVDAIAGTAPLENGELLETPKRRKEWDFVSAFLKEQMESLCASWQTSPEPSAIQAHNVAHLYQMFSGILKPDIDDALLIRTLHPTPAVSGFPREEAWRLLKKLEPFKRQFYAAPIGWISPHLTDIHVALRCGEIVDNALHLYAGAGLVEESTAQEEWEEIDTKMQPWLKIFNA